VSRVWLIRHAASTALPGLAVGATDPQLSDHGRVQAAGLAATMATSPLVRILSSDRRRAIDTARIMAEPHGLAVEPTEALREIDFGAWEGRALTDLWIEEPAAAQAWTDDIRITPPSFGESLDDLQRRVAAFWASLLPLPERGDIAVVAHGGSLAALRAVITGEAIRKTLATRLSVAGAVALTAG
jgi:broad specificity phosphatase PhoE